MGGDRPDSQPVRRSDRPGCDSGHGLPVRVEDDPTTNRERTNTVPTVEQSPSAGHFVKCHISRTNGPLERGAEHAYPDKKARQAEPPLLVRWEPRPPCASSRSSASFFAFSLMCE